MNSTEAYLQKVATAWKERLRAGVLGTKSLGKILDRAGMSRPDEGVKRLHERVSHPAYAKGQEYHNPMRGRPIKRNPNYTYDNTRKDLKQISRALADRSGEYRSSDLFSIFPSYKGHLDRRIVDGYTNYIAQNAGEDGAVLAKLVARRDKTPISSKKFIGSSEGVIPYDRNKPWHEQLKQTRQSPYGAGMALQDISAALAPLGIGSPTARHEIAHLIDSSLPRADRFAVLKELHQTLRRNPEVMRAIARQGLEGSVFIREGMAQMIASKGNSNSAKRFISKYIDAAKNSGIDDLLRLLPKSLEKDPSGRDAAVITQLMRNYELRV
jgi:hypothetical protein